MSSGGKPTEPSREVANFLRVTHREMDELLDKGETFTHLETDIGPSAWRRASLTGTIKRVDGVSSNEWTLSEHARNRLQEYREQAVEYPDGTKVCPFCGYRGFRNLREGGFRCQNVTCGREFSRFAEVGENV